jgi:hypothetical protein
MPVIADVLPQSWSVTGEPGETTIGVVKVHVDDTADAVVVAGLNANV